MADVVRVIVPIDTMDEESWKFATAYSYKIASEATPPATDIVLLTHTKQILDHSSLAQHLGKATAKALAKGTKVGFAGGMTLRHETPRTLGYSARNSVVIIFYAEDKILETLDGHKGITGIVAVPDFEDQIEVWSKRWNPIVHGAKREKAKELVEDPVVEKALESITLRSNISYNVLHPRDKAYANEVFRILKAKGHALDGAMIKSWAIRKGWKPGGADELRKVADKVSALKAKPSLAGFHDPAGRYERWQS